MNNKLSKYVNALFLLAGALAWLVSKHYIVVLIGYFQLARKIGTTAEVLTHVLPLVIGVGTFWLLYQNRTSNDFTTDAVGELTRVSWPGAKEVRLGTIVVIITVVLAGLILGAIDLGFTSVIKTIINS